MRSLYHRRHSRPAINVRISAFSKAHREVRNFPPSRFVFLHDAAGERRAPPTQRQIISAPALPGRNYRTCRPRTQLHQVHRATLLLLALCDRIAECFRKVSSRLFARVFIACNTGLRGGGFYSHITERAGGKGAVGPGCHGFTLTANFRCPSYIRTNTSGDESDYGSSADWRLWSLSSFKNCPSVKTRWVIRSGLRIRNVPFLGRQWLLITPTS